MVRFLEVALETFAVLWGAAEYVVLKVVDRPAIAKFTKKSCHQFRSHAASLFPFESDVAHALHFVDDRTRQFRLIECVLFRRCQIVETVEEQVLRSQEIFELPQLARAEVIRRKRLAHHGSLDAGAFFALKEVCIGG